MALFKSKQEKIIEDMEYKLLNPAYKGLSEAIVEGTIKEIIKNPEKREEIIQLVDNDIKNLKILEHDIKYVLKSLKKMPQYGRLVSDLEKSLGIKNTIVKNLNSFKELFSHQFPNQDILNSTLEKITRLYTAFEYLYADAIHFIPNLEQKMVSFSSVKSFLTKAAVIIMAITLFACNTPFKKEVWDNMPHGQTITMEQVYKGRESRKFSIHFFGSDRIIVIKDPSLIESMNDLAEFPKERLAEKWIRKNGKGGVPYLIKIDEHRAILMTLDKDGFSSAFIEFK